MPQLTKGGKWVFGWGIVGQEGEIRIPPEAYSECGFQPGEPVIFILGSQRSGGFGVKTLAIQPGERLLVVRGSGLALGFLQQGPIYEEAQHHPQIEVFAA